MPIYDYYCETCGYELNDVSQKLNDPPPLCEDPTKDTEKNFAYCLKPMKKKISKTSFALKGATWARDNYSRKSK